MDIVERAELALKRDSVKHHGQLVRELVAALKSARTELDNLKAGSPDIEQAT